MEWLRRYSMKRMFKKKEGIKKMKGIIMPSIQKQLDKASKRSRNCEYLQASPTKFEVVDGDDRFTVELEKKTCTCFKWDLTGVPCSHACLCIPKKRLTLHSFVDVAYSKEMYKKAYEHSINPVPGPKQWEVTPHTQPEPPPYRKMSGR
ncbi:uncharacterized protein LOC141641614 [Silene latifolia]|uniref:uncharacterized protein LOC141641614 n=1 Tax=Silene latifolia TaxID=37657 RepID=UPI003D77825F